jgi:hypothetical protein
MNYTTGPAAVNGPPCGSMNVRLPSSATSTNSEKGPGWGGMEMSHRTPPKVLTARIPVLAAR